MAEDSRARTGETQKLVEGVDFYYEGAYMVFTAEYLRRRGYCCGSGCRHCPYDPQEQQRAGRPSVSERKC
ncbi:MAG TPA: DUF5522 domain-containing protein [Terriglobales bacterium]|nr:DUF5522 domain-containing protein [Terriglobales bacterium]